MNLEDKIKSIIFEIGREIKIHKIDEDNTILEIDYEKYTRQILEAINQKDS